MSHKIIPIASAAPSRERKRRQPKGRRVDPAALAEVQSLLGARPRRRDLLIEYLHLLNDHYGFLGAPHLAALARELRLSQAEVYEVATFYHHFDVVKEAEPGKELVRPELTVRVCASLSCELAGAAELLARLPDMLGAGVRVLAAPCVGRCEQAPIAVVGQKAITQATAAGVHEAVRHRDVVQPMPDFIDRPTYTRQGGYRLLGDCVSGRLGVEAVLQALEGSGLRGLGGAGFPAGRKWRVVRGEPGPRLMAVNLDEGEPGTFKDRSYLERDPHRFLEGMLIAAWAVQASAIYIYLRDEYHGCRAMLQALIDDLRAHPPMDGMPALHLRRGAGAYICGEESAMIESIEGKRGLPRLRPPFVAQAGLFGRPTLQHNFETLYWVRDILERGADWFASHGRAGRKGLRSFSVSGRVRRPGVHVAPAGISVRQLIDEYCGGMAEGHELYAYLPGGASGGILPASLDHLPLDFDTLQPYGAFIGSAAVIVLSRHDSAVAAARNLSRFFRDESCGQCTPCRAGTAKAADLIAGHDWDKGLLSDLSMVMRDASICGLGQAAPNPIDSVLQYFPHELDALRAEGP